MATAVRAFRRGGGPIFVRGIMPRSGTNFLADLLRLHPGVCVNPNDIWEFPHFRALSFLEQYIHRLSVSPKTPSFDADEFRRCLGDAWCQYLGNYFEREQRIVLKDPSFGSLPKVFDYFPDACLLLVLRDLRDVVASGLKAGFVAPPKFSLGNRHSWHRLFGPSDFVWICRKARAEANEFLRFQQSSEWDRRRAQILVVRYEDLVNDIEPQARRILVHCSLDLSVYPWDKLVRLPVRGSSFLRDASGKMNFARGISQPGDFQPVGRWHDWCGHKRRRFHRELAETMGQLMYPLEEDWIQPKTTPRESAPGGGSQAVVRG